ncbi:MAG: 3-isopropylmalate dehydratase small subunit [Dehalococcoidia bacterium]|nr:3-isopropylmalate dehydratase small subunit [Dehalococcoidia bacterium]
MEAFTRLTGVVAPLPRVNVDTDQIIPKQFLKRIERTGFGEFAFFDWRYLPDGSPNPDFELNRPEYEGAAILVTGRNFGCGSSREHAPWALREMGFRAIIASSFADIFFNNCVQNGMLPIVLPEEQVREIISRAQRRPGYRLSVNLENQSLYDSEGLEEHFEIDVFVRERLLKGQDDIAMTLEHEDEVAAFEARRPRWLEPSRG